MITRQTTFILGAGFSKELGMPLGSKLKRDIRAEALRVLTGQGRRVLDVCLEEAFSEAGQDLGDALLRIAGALEYHASIDGLVEHFSDAPGIALAARYLIADRILWYESKREWARVSFVDFGQEKRPFAQIQQASGTGMKALFDRMMAGTTLASVARAFEKIGFVNFNYDRTLEQYIYLALIERSGLKPLEAAGLVRNIQIWRPYGGVGKLALLDGEAVPGVGLTDFGASDSASLKAAAGHIRTYSEADEAPPIREAHKFMAGSDVIAFLGCAYHGQNLDLLKRDNSLRVRSPRIYGTHYQPPPEDPDGHAQLGMERFLQPAAAALSQRLWDLLGPARRFATMNVVLEPLTSQQLIEMYGPTWA